MTAPTLEHEQTLWQLGNIVAGVDEVGRGALAGPVVAGVVVFEPTHQPIIGITDSKKLSKKIREELARVIRTQAASWAVGEASAQEIDEMGIVPATVLAMQRALENFEQLDHVLIDGLPFKDPLHLQSYQKTFIVKGDSLSYSIAAASILAKVHRDELMAEYGKQYPEYGFEKHVGYGTKNHREAIKTAKPTKLHRKSFIQKILKQFT